jgi:hypothetical protein
MGRPKRKFLAFQVFRRLLLGNLRQVGGREFWGDDGEVMVNVVNVCRLKEIVTSLSFGSLTVNTV